MEIFVIDTNFFVNLQRDLKLGNSKEEVVENFVRMAIVIKRRTQTQFITTPGSFKELESFYQGPISENLLRVITIASPNITEIKLDATLFYQLVEEIGKRLYRGLRVAEEPLKQVFKDAAAAEQNYIKQLREKYRRATRDGFLDSTTDLELILLSREKGGVLVTSDNGLLGWARRFGCQEMLPEQFVARLRDLS